MTYRSPIKHCRACGTAVVYRLPDDGDTKQRAVCPACNTVHYENPLNVVGTVPALPDGRILLCKRNIEPRWGKWTLPAGFMELDETTAQGAARETDEEAGAQIDTLRIKLLKVAAVVTRNTRRIRLYLASNWPSAQTFAHAMSQLRSP